MPTITDQAIALRNWDWSETSQTVSLFCRDHGLIRGVAKGAKREKGRFSGGIETLTAGQVVAIVKPGRDLATLTDWDLQEVFRPLRTDLRCHYAGVYMADIVQHAITDEDPHPALWSVLRDALAALREGEDPGAEVLRFQWATLEETGYRPDLSIPDEAARDAAIGFDPDAGRIVPDPGPEAGDVPWRVRRETLSLLRSSFLDAPDEAQEHAPHAVRRASRLLATYLDWIFGRRPPSTMPYFEINKPG